MNKLFTIMCLIGFSYVKGHPGLQETEYAVSIRNGQILATSTILRNLPFRGPADPIITMNLKPCAPETCQYDFMITNIVKIIEYGTELKIERFGVRQVDRRDLSELLCNEIRNYAEMVNLYNQYRVLQMSDQMNRMDVHIKEKEMFIKKQLTGVIQQYFHEIAQHFKIRSVVELNISIIDNIDVEAKTIWIDFCTMILKPESTSMVRIVETPEIKEFTVGDESAIKKKKPSNKRSQSKENEPINK